MATLKQIRRRIRSIQSTMQITKAMEMVAAAKLRRAQSRSLAARPYVNAMQASLARVAAAAPPDAHPLLTPRVVKPELERELFIVIASDKGLCGSFNTHILSQAERRLDGMDRERVRFVAVGRRAVRYFQYRHRPMWRAIERLGDQLDFDLVRELARLSIDAFTSGEVDRVEVLHHRFITTARRETLLDRLIPVVGVETEKHPRQYIFEPDAATVLATLLPRFVTTRLLSMIADSLAAEHSARMLAMGNATRNAQDMIGSLTLKANKLRQATITRELIDIVGGSVTE